MRYTAPRVRYLIKPYLKSPGVCCMTSSVSQHKEWKEN